MIVLIVALEDELSRQPMPEGVVLIHSGVGKLNAALATVAAIAQHRPRLIINYGTAGAVHERARGLLEVGRVIQRDMDAEPLAPRGTTPFATLPSDIRSGVTGICCATGDSFVRSADAWLHEQHADIVDMELFAIADVCRRSALPWRAWKYITDNADDNAANDWSATVNAGEPLFMQALTGAVAGPKP
jgi:adenosylhomocysteine nucleosidase